MSSPLAERMRAYARSNPGNERMFELADDLDHTVELANHQWDPTNMKRMIGAVARARLHWCAVTGEPLV